MAKTGPKGPSRYTDKYLNKLSIKLLKWIEEKRNFWLGNFAADNNMSRQELLRVAKSHDKLSDALKKAKQIQENKLVGMGLSKNFNGTFVIFTLKNVAGWRDKTEHTHKGKISIDNIKNASNEELSTIAKEGFNSGGNKRTSKKRTVKKKVK